MFSPITLQTIYSTIQRMRQSPGDSVRMVSQLRNMITELPPPHAELVSRYQFARGALWTYPVNFFDVPEDGYPPVQIVELPHDAWIRGVQALCLPRLDATFVTNNDLLVAAEQRRLLSEALGTNWRGLFDLTYRISTRQGFISTGTGDIEPPAALVSGDGQYSAELDWRLQKKDTIQVRIRNRIGEVFGDAVTPAIDRTLPWVACCFWGEELPQPR